MIQPPRLWTETSKREKVGVFQRFHLLFSCFLSETIRMQFSQSGNLLNERL